MVAPQKLLGIRSEYGCQGCYQAHSWRAQINMSQYTEYVGVVMQQCIRALTADDCMHYEIELGSNAVQQLAANVATNLRTQRCNSRQLK